MNIKRVFVSLIVMFLIVPNSFGIGLTGNVFIKQESETAAKAKADAINDARRQILTNVLSSYTDREQLRDLIENTVDDDLMNLISSSSVSGEQMSNTEYSANITMNIDNDAARKWLNDNNVQNWVPKIESDERFTCVIVLDNGLVDWSDLKRAVRQDGFEIETQSIVGNQIVAKMPLNYRSKFTVGVREMGWKYADNGGVLQIWK